MDLFTTMSRFMVPAPFTLLLKYLEEEFMLYA